MPILQNYLGRILNAKLFVYYFRMYSHQPALFFCIYSPRSLIIVHKEHNDYFLWKESLWHEIYDLHGHCAEGCEDRTNLKIFPAVWPEYDGSKRQLPVRLPGRPEATPSLLPRSLH